MSELETAKGLDLYLFDQLQKGRITKEAKILDAGCGSGRNLVPLRKFGYDVIGIDPSWGAVEHLHHSGFGKDIVIGTDIIGYKTNRKFDFIICNAVLHFAESHTEFDALFSKLWELLENTGTLFIRMTSDFATKLPYSISDKGIAILPDNSNRYILTKEKLQELEVKHKLEYLEPIKTTNVQDLRCMTTLVLRKIKS